MKEIQDFCSKDYEINPRHTIRLVQNLEKIEHIKKHKIKGKRKRKGYIINEDNIGTLSEIWFNFPKSKYIPKARQEEWTQDMLRQMINQWRKNVRLSLQEIKKGDSKSTRILKKQMKESFGWIHLQEMFHCSKLITQFTWALRTGILGTGKGKINRTLQNIHELEDFLEEMANNLKEYDEQIWYCVIGNVYNTLDNSRGMSFEKYDEMIKPKL